MKRYLLLVLLMLSQNCFAETIEEKVARNAASCFIGHKAISSKADQSGENLKYLELITKLIGIDATKNLVLKTSDNLKFAVFSLGTSNQIEGAALVKEYCPQIDELLKK